MLFDPKKWDKIRPNRAGLIRFLETKNPDCEYDYLANNGDCLIGEFFASLGKRWGPFTIFTPSYIRLDRFAREKPRTYGAALERARAEI